MIGLLQRVSSARVEVSDTPIAGIDAGLLVLVGIHKADSKAHADRLLTRILGYRVFADAEGRMRLSLSETGGGLLLVPQFTLVADTRKGSRPGFDPAAPADQARPLFDYLVHAARDQHPRVASGCFGADMSVHLVNQGPATFWLEVG